MISSTQKKLFYIIIINFLTLLILSYPNIVSGGSILWGQESFFLIFISSLMLLLTINLLYSDKINKLDIISVFLFSFSLILLFWVSTGKFLMDIDSIISIHSVEFISKNGFSVELVKKGHLIFSATYSLPLLSILASLCSLVTNISYVIITKYLPLILACGFLLLYYIFVKTALSDKKAALISILLIISFPVMINMGDIFVNLILANLFIVLLWYLIYKKQDQNKMNISIIQIIILVGFVITHHLTFLIMILTIAMVEILNFIKYKSNLNKLNKITYLNLLILGIVLMLVYYVFVYFGPLSIMLNSFTGNLVVEGAAPTAPTGWDIKILFQRLCWAIFVISSILILVKSKSFDLSEIIKEKYGPLFIIGFTIFLISIFTLIIQAPFSLDRIAIFGWMLFIPAISSFFINNDSKKKKFFVVICLLLFIGNICVIPINILSHSGDNEYQDSKFKNWVKDQEYDSVIWLTTNKNQNKSLTGDEIVRRLFFSNSQYLPENFKYHQITQNTITNFDYLILRKENFFRIVGPDKNLKINNSSYNDILNNETYGLIYDNYETETFLKI